MYGYGLQSTRPQANLVLALTPIIILILALILNLTLTLTLKSSKEWVDLGMSWLPPMDTNVLKNISTEVYIHFTYICINVNVANSFISHTSLLTACWNQPFPKWTHSYGLVSRSGSGLRGIRDSRVRLPWERINYYLLTIAHNRSFSYFWARQPTDDFRIAGLTNHYNVVCPVSSSVTNNKD